MPKHNGSQGEAHARLNGCANRAEQKLTFLTSRKSGLTIAASARAAGVSENTGQRWDRDRKRGALLNSALATPLMAKSEARAILADRVKDPLAPTAAIVQALALLARLEGWEAPARIEQTVRQVPQGVVAWIDSLRVAPAPGPRQLASQTATAPALPAAIGQHGDSDDPLSADTPTPPTLSERTHLPN